MNGIRKKSGLKCIKTAVLFLLIFYSQKIILAQQDMRFEHITVENGLPENSVTAIVQDHLGFLWFGTQNGLVRYDGYNFIIYKPDVLDSLSISDRAIEALFEDSKKNLWVGTFSGLNKYVRAKNNFIHIRNYPDDIHSISDDNIRSISEDKNGTLWIGTGKGLNKLVITNDGPTNNEKYIFERFLNDSNDVSSISNNYIKEIMEDKSGNLWIGTSDGLNLFDKKKSKFYRFKHDGLNPHSISGNLITTIYEDIYGNLWVGTTRGLNKFNRDDTSFIRFEQFEKNYRNLKYSNWINNFLLDKSGNSWICTSDGLFISNHESDSIITFDINRYLEDQTVWTVFEDRASIIWVGTWMYGLYKFDRRQQIFTHFIHRKDDQNSLVNDTVCSFYEDNHKNFWIGTKGAIDLYDRNEKTFKHPFNKFNSKLEGSYVKSIAGDTSGDLWIGTGGKGLFKLNKLNQNYKIYRNKPADPASLSCDWIETIYFDKSGGLWIGTSEAQNYRGGLNKYDPEADGFVRYLHEKNNPNSISDNEILSIYEDNQKNLWVGTNMGALNKFDRSNNIFFSNFENINDIPTISDFLEDRHGRLWFGSYRHGLIQFDRNCCALKRITQKDGLLSDDAAGHILEDSRGNIWVRSTDNRISVFNPDTYSFRYYEINKDIPLTAKFENFWAFYKASNGEFFVGGVNGFCSFLPDSIKLNTNIPPVVITSFKISGNEFPLDTSVSEKKELSLTHRDNNFSFEFASLDYSNPLMNRYAYKLEGFDKDWFFTDAGHRIANYTNIDPGEYIFRVKGSNNDDVWNEEGASIKIIITPPWWQRWWFRLSGALTIMGIAGLLFNQRISKIKKEKKAQEEFTRQLIDTQESERKRIAGELHDSLGQNLLVIKNKARLGLKTHKAYEELKDISDLTSATLNEVREISYNLHPHLLDRLGLTKAIGAIVNRVFDSTDIKFNKNIVNIDSLFNPQSEINVYRIIQESINNIIKHSSASEAEISIKKGDGSISILISDNGKGFVPDAVSFRYEKGGGFGLKGISERVKLLGGKFNIESAPGAGTKIFITIPLM